MTRSTISEALAEARARLAAAGVPHPDLDAELLLRHVLGWDRARLVVEGRAPLPPAPEAAYNQLLARRAARIPLQHLTGVQAFWRHDFAVTPDVLIPRPETEILVAAALDLLRGIASPRVVDVGTGSGCLAISLAAERPDAEIHAVDLSPAAIRVAEDNARTAGVRVTFHEGDLLSPFPPVPAFHLVVSNPPYVTAEEVDGLEPEVRDHDPRLALVPPEGVAAMYGRLFAEAASRLLPGGAVAVEMGASQRHLVGEAARSAGLAVREVRPDLGGRDRVAIAVPPHPPV